ncbi:MAG: hypothetical protein JWQ04_1575 [Pedosphaera sp.]|nr:hypothetical protein [Pedosphaera sp.]
MAKTNKIVRTVKVSPVLAGALPREAHSKPAGLYLMALRSHHVEARSPLPRRKLVITVDPENGPEGLPKVIKITHA